MELDHAICYRAMSARDARFDGLFFIGVTTTGIYCRPVCTARVPGRERCRFFAHQAAAERQGFRPCMRCRPELAPGHAPVDAVRTVARLAATRIDAGVLNNGGSLDQLADEIGISARQLRRAVQREFGASPIELAQTRRLLLAKQLLTETALPMVQVALASGFESVRRFNASFRGHYRLTPSAMRRSPSATKRTDGIRLTLAYRPPYAWQSLLRFLADRATNGVEQVIDGAYLRTVEYANCKGWLRVAPCPNRDALSVELDMALAPVLPAMLARLRGLFDLDARPDAIAEQLRADAMLRGPIERTPGIRVPGACDGFELAVRAILGQRISVKAATTLAGRLAAALGDPCETPFAGLDRLSPTAERLAETRTTRLTDLGIHRQVALAIRAVARAVAKRQIKLDSTAQPEETVQALVALPGIGPWTAQYIALRALRWPDAFPDGDLGLRKAAHGASARGLSRRAESWRPWRAYAAVLLWESLQPESGEVHDERVA